MFKTLFRQQAFYVSDIFHTAAISLCLLFKPTINRLYQYFCTRSIISVLNKSCNQHAQHIVMPTYGHHVINFTQNPLRYHMLTLKCWWVFVYTHTLYNTAYIYWVVEMLRFWEVHHFVCICSVVLNRYHCWSCDLYIMWFRSCDWSHVR